ncbi:ubiquitin-conjugating enzyme E2 J1 [Podospora fimiseda]|uniref:Ubiquitin-conjugating enzyme E2 J1 n=1 Tax=Podospora fimiseda TaxID=252190 RepID=A0AAN7H295_9PEZI|nr:ubiquitin-conjugating enzyme E2 J1 [Podospora fimiseda]
MQAGTFSSLRRNQSVNCPPSPTTKPKLFFANSVINQNFPLFPTLNKNKSSITQLSLPLHHFIINPPPSSTPHTPTKKTTTMTTSIPTTAPRFNSRSPTIKRILRESHELATSPSPDLHAVPLETDLFEWHFTLRGPPNSPFENGIYHGRIVLPPTYPLRPPSFRFLTPSGRFEVNREICLSISGHHEETWQPAWGVRTALVALRSFMETDVKGQLGGMESNEATRKQLAAESKKWTCPGCCNNGKSNEEIMRDCEEAVRVTGGETKEEEKVPEELKLGWKDEMGKKDDEESDLLAEGFVQTGNPGEGSSAGTTEARRRRPGGPLPPGLADTEEMVPHPDLLAQQQQRFADAEARRIWQGQQDREAQRVREALARQAQRAQRVRVSNDDVWLDRLILAVAVLLAAAVAKVMLV